MKIEKKKFSGNSRLSNTTKAGIATLLGLSAVYMSACSKDSPTSGPIIEPTDNAGSSDSTNPETTSSSSIVDIPLSNEAVSSSVIEALSSEANQNNTTQSSSSITGQNSSSDTELSSSSVSQPVDSTHIIILKPDTTLIHHKEIETIDSINVHFCPKTQNDSTSNACYTRIDVVSMVTTFEIDDILVG